MSQRRVAVQLINPELFESKPGDSDHPVASKTRWAPAKPGGASSYRS